MKNEKMDIISVSLSLITFFLPLPLTELYGCDISPCLHGGTCTPQTPTAQNTKKYKCDCADGKNRGDLYWLLNLRNIQEIILIFIN